MFGIKYVKVQKTDPKIGTFVILNQDVTAVGKYTTTKPIILEVKGFEHTMLGPEEDVIQDISKLPANAQEARAENGLSEFMLDYGKGDTAKLNALVLGMPNDLKKLRASDSGVVLFRMGWNGLTNNVEMNVLKVTDKFEPADLLRSSW